jgi:hypothetical protein
MSSAAPLSLSLSLFLLFSHLLLLLQMTILFLYSILHHHLLVLFLLRHLPLNVDTLFFLQILTLLIYFYNLELMFTFFTLAFVHLPSLSLPLGNCVCGDFLLNSQNGLTTSSRVVNNNLKRCVCLESLRLKCDCHFYSKFVPRAKKKEGKEISAVYFVLKRASE